jgi:hypothetical protein
MFPEAGNSPRSLTPLHVVCGNVDAYGTPQVLTSFARAVDEMIASVYDDIGHVSTLPARALFDLFVIKVLYVGRRSQDASVVDYIAAMLDAYLDVRRLFPDDAHGRRGYADSALFLSGIFSAASRKPLRSGGPLRGHRTQFVDRGYYIATGKTMYSMAARDHHRGCAHEPGTLEKMSLNFELYADALREMSETYINGYPTAIIADKMLDSMNAGDARSSARYLELLEA